MTQFPFARKLSVLAAGTALGLGSLAPAASAGAAETDLFPEAEDARAFTGGTAG